MSSIPALIFVAIVTAAIVSAVVFMGVYTYRDAKRRGMNAALWAAVAVAAPSFSGFVVYLIVRAAHPDLRCARCGQLVEEDFIVCPGCGVKLRAVCPGCGSPVEPGWSVCPRCAHVLGGGEDACCPPVRRSERTVWWVTAAILLVPVLLASALLMLLWAAPNGGAPSVTSATYGQVSIEDYFTDPELPPEVAEQVGEWLREAQGNPGEGAALVYDASEDGESSSGDCFCLVFVPSARLAEHFTATASGGRLDLEFRSFYKGDTFVMIQSTDRLGLRLALDGKRISCSVQEVDYNPTLYIIF